MIDHLCVFVAHLEGLSQEEQAKIATQLEEILEKNEWDALVKRPGAKVFHEQLREEARQAIQA
jgi:DnaJ-domain-containing protein 1